MGYPSAMSIWLWVLVALTAWFLLSFLAAAVVARVGLARQKTSASRTGRLVPATARAPQPAASPDRSTRAGTGAHVS